MISIVDDDKSVRESTKALVRSLGYAARTFPSVEEFLTSNLDATSCLILDVQLKGLSGIELQERLIGEGRRTPIIFITAVLDEQIRNQALKAGAIDILSKPFSGERLASCLVSALSKEEAPCGGATGLLEMDAPVGEPVQTGHVSARRGHYRLKRRYPE